jgi:hypothetical protein
MLIKGTGEKKLALFFAPHDALVINLVNVPDFYFQKKRLKPPPTKYKEQAK